MQDTPLYLGIDLGGTNIQAGLVNTDGKVVLRDSTKTKPAEGHKAVLERIEKLAQSLSEKAGVSPAAVGIGAPGAVDPRTGVVLTAVNLGWTDYALGKNLTKKLNLPVFVDNDVNVGAWGEFATGASKKHQDLLAVFVGTGIGGGIILGGDLFHGHFRTAGEIGHVVLNADGRMGHRTLENRASRTTIADQIIRMIKAGRPSLVTELCGGDYSKVRSKILSQAFSAQDALTVQVIEQAAADVGTAIAGVVTLLSLPCVILGGGLTEALGEPWVERVRAGFNANVFPPHLQEAVILAGRLGDDAGVVGAALLARDRAKNSAT